MSKKSARNSKILLIALAVVFAWFCYSSYNQYNRWQQMEQEVANYQQQYDKVLAEGKALLEEKEKLDDPQYIEQIAREKLRMINKDEFLIIPAEDSDVPTLDDTYIDESELH